MFNITWEFKMLKNISVLSVVIFAISLSLAATINVPADYTTIQAGLNVATSGDTVLVAAGTYTENIIWPNVNGIKLISAGDSSNTVIDGGGTSSVVYMNPFSATIDTTTVIQGFKITNGSNVTNGGGVFIKTGSPILYVLLISYNSASYGGGIYAEASGLIIKNCTISNNSVFLFGGGVYYKNATSTTRIDNSTIIFNSTRFDQGGLYSG